MPVTSAKQMRFMYAAKEGKIPGVSPKVGSEFIGATPQNTLKRFGKISAMMKKPKKLKMPS